MRTEDTQIDCSDCRDLEVHVSVGDILTGQEVRCTSRLTVQGSGFIARSSRGKEMETRQHLFAGIIADHPAMGPRLMSAPDLISGELRPQTAIISPIQIPLSKGDLCYLYTSRCAPYILG